VSPNKQAVERYMQAFDQLDHAAVLSLLTDDVEWVVPGMYVVRGKAAFDQHIENDAFVGRPGIVVTRLIEQDDVVVAEGRVSPRRTDGTVLSLVFCDVFELRAGRIRRLTSYLMEVKA
jgi:ketosteroid isomerase-like protein